MAPKYTISVLCLNHVKLTRACLESVLKHSGGNYEIIVTDNGSVDETEAYLKDAAKQFGPRMRVVRNPKNEGFQIPNEHALAVARGEFFVMLNNDMVVCEGWLDKLAEPFADPTIAISGPLGNCTGITNEWGPRKGYPVEYIEGSCAMIPTALARKHGLFAPYLSFAYWEDTDLSWRMQELGYRLAVVDIPMRHDKPGSTSKTLNLRDVQAKNTAAMKKRWGFYVARRTFQKRVCIRRLGARGDVLLATPALKAYRERFPQYDVHIITKCPEMLAGMDGITISSAKRPTKWFDEFIDLDLAYEKRPDVHIVQAFADALGVSLPPFWNMEVHPTANDLAWGFKRSRGAKVALIHGGVTCWPGKNWPIDRMEEVVAHLKSEGFFTIAVGDESSPDCGCDDSIAGEATVQQFYALAIHASLFIGLDSMPMHVATAANVPSVIAFGPTNPRAICRPTPRVIPVFADVKEIPCVGAHGRRTIPVTASPCNSECINGVTVNDMLKAIKRVRILSQ